jgi:hypothetical protein
MKYPGSQEGKENELQKKGGEEEKRGTQRPSQTNALTF